MKSILSEHFARYPKMEIRDFVKLIYQHTFGCGHMVDDSARSLAFLQAETETCEENGDRLFTPIGNGLVRCSLSAMRQTDLRPEALNRFFVYTARHFRGTSQQFAENLQIFRVWAAEHGFAMTEVDAFLADYRGAGYPSLHHSETYRALYRPAYRVVTEDLARYIEIFIVIETLCREKDFVTVAIDGMSASGKSTFGDLCRALYACNLFHTDDYFLRPEQRTEQRLSEVGGNVDYERFYAEILEPLQHKVPFSYRPYSCMTQSLDAPVKVTPCKLNLVEGAYSCHPYFGDCYDVRICMTVDADLQRERILKRNGAVMLKRFETEWIPKENAYLSQMLFPQADILRIHQPFTDFLYR